MIICLVCDVIVTSVIQAPQNQPNKSSMSDVCCCDCLIFYLCNLIMASCGENLINLATLLCSLWDKCWEWVYFVLDKIKIITMFQWVFFRWSKWIPPWIYLITFLVCNGSVVQMRWPSLGCTTHNKASNWRLPHLHNSVWNVDIMKKSSKN